MALSSGTANLLLPYARMALHSYSEWGQYANRIDDAEDRYIQTLATLQLRNYGAITVTVYLTPPLVGGALGI